MGCNCGNNNIRQPIPQITQYPSPSQPCGFTVDVLNNWNNKLLCAKQNGYNELLNLTVFNLNQYLGLVQSALSYPQDPCYFKNELNRIAPIINQIVQLTNC